MITIDPQQELFTALKLGLKAKGHKTFDGVMPPESEPYPFDFLGDNQQNDTALKNAVTGVVHQTIHIWHTTKQRGALSEMLQQAKAVFYQLEHTANYSWGVRNLSTRIITDKTTNTPLLHGVIEADFYFS